MKLIIVVFLLLPFTQSYYHNCAPCICTRRIEENVDDLMIYKYNLEKKALITANCNQKDINTNLERIPNSVDGYIQVLYFEDQFMAEITGQSELNDYSDLQEVYLSHNNISELAHSPFSELHNLTKLDLSFNKIHELQSHIFYNNPKLVYLLLNNNNIHELPSDLFSNLPVLAEVHLQENKIHTISKNTFNRVPYLYSIDLSKNKLETLQLNIIDNTRSIEYLILHGNPWNCNSSLCEIRETALNKDWLPSIPFCQLPVKNSWKDMRNNSLEITTHQNADNLDLVCEYSNCLSNVLVWTYNNTVLLRKETNKLVLTLNNITNTHEGLYTCFVLARNRVDQSEIAKSQKIYLKVQETNVISCNDTCEPAIPYNDTQNATKSSPESKKDTTKPSPETKKGSISWPDFGFGALAGLLTIPAICLSLSLACGLSCCIPCCNCCSSCCCCRLLKWMLKILIKMFAWIGKKLNKRLEDMDEKDKNNPEENQLNEFNHD